jgi:hypothetical protein
MPKVRVAKNKANLRARLAARKLDRSKKCSENRAEVSDVTRDEHDAELDELMKELEVATESHVIRTRTSKRGRPCSDEFEGHCRFLMATGASAKSCRDQVILNRNFMLKGDAKRDFVMPELDWFKKLRECVGLHSWMHAMMRVAGAGVVRQFGHDGTSIDCVATFNQWCLAEEGGKLEREEACWWVAASGSQARSPIFFRFLVFDLAPRFFAFPKTLVPLLN